MGHDHFLDRLRSDLQPKTEVQARIQRKMHERIGAPMMFAELRSHLTPQTGTQKAIWRRLSKSLVLPSGDMLERLKKQLAPTADLPLQLKERILLRLTTPTSFGIRSLQWAAAFALVALVVRVSPLLFIASPTVAESSVIVLSTRGYVSVSIGGLWQPVTDEIEVEPGMVLRTENSEASILFRDDGVVRLGPHTVVEIHDVSDRLEPAPDVLPTLTLHEGRVWMQGLIPTRLRGITVATAGGHITVNEGSVSLIKTEEAVTVTVFDRRATVLHSDDMVVLTQGETVDLRSGVPLVVKNIANESFQEYWPTQNLQKDAVHREEIAALQHERRVANAGILPTSKFYPVKRIAEKMDVLMTIGEEGRLQKQLLLAETRLNEAAALLAEGEDEGATTSLAEYRGTLLAIMSGSGDANLAQFLVQQSVAETTAEVAAALPGDANYIIKKAVLEASADLPDTVFSGEDAQGDLLLDGLTVITRKVYEGDTTDVESLWNEVQPYVLALETGSHLRPDVYKEATTLLSFLAESLADASEQGQEVDPELMERVTPYLPVTDTTVEPLTDDEINDIVRAIWRNVFVYDMTQSRVNQFTQEISALEGHPDQGRILRRLQTALPDGPEHFPDRIYKEIVRLRWEKSAE